MDSHKNDATYCLSLSADGDICEIGIAGKLTMQDIVELKEKINEMAVLHKIEKMLIDVRDARAEIGYPETYLLAMMTPPYFEKIFSAVVYAPEYAHLALFHEELMTQNGIPTKFFTDIDEARNWLKKCKGKTPPVMLH